MFAHMTFYYIEDQRLRKFEWFLEFIKFYKWNSQDNDDFAYRDSQIKFSVCLFFLNY